MAGLPPTNPSVNKVKIRSKTNSFKRPFSCDGSDVVKKESKGLFHNLRKGVSNSKLNEDVDVNENSENNIPVNNLVNEEKSIIRLQGRNFDSDDEDYDLTTEDTSVIKMDELFANQHNVMNNPALLGYLLKYLSSHNVDYNSLLYYLVVQHYKATVQLKEFNKDIPRFANEIITTFLHDKSILKIDHKIDIVSMLNDLKANNGLLEIFNNSSDEIYKHCIKQNIEKIRTSIKHGLFTLEVSVGKFNFDAKMNFFNECIKYVIKNLEDKIPRESNNTVTKEIKEKEHYVSDIITGVKTSLATIVYYFSKKDKEDSAETVSMISNKHLRASFLGRSQESLQMMTNSVLDKHLMFCSKLQKKQSSHSFFKKGKSIRGHNFQDKTFEYPVECLLCQKLLWGINPQGLYCSYCQEAVHKYCKDHVRTNCNKEVKRFIPNHSNVNQTNEEEVAKIGGGEEDSLSTHSQMSNNIDIKESQESKDDNDNNPTVLDENTDKQMTSSVSSDSSQFVRTNYVVSTASIFVTNNDDRPSLNQDTESLGSVSELSSDRHQEFFKTDIDIKNDIHHEERKYLTPGYIPSGHVKSIASKYDQKNIPRSQSLRKTIHFKFGDDNMENKTLPRSVKRGSESVFIQDLVADSSLWVDDPDMKVNETFEANKELEDFRYHLTKEEDKAEYTRLLVLMEFHHKIKFTVMTLKRFDYLLIKQWPSDDNLLFKTLSLNNITPLYELIKSLDATIKISKTSTSYSKDMAQNVINWLVSNYESNLQEWLKYSIDLCCTNSLNLVKSFWQDCRRTDVRFSKVLNKRHNKMIMVEQLSNMRPLLFNLPLIVSKIYKDLNKFSKFKEETKIWKEIHEKFKKLPTFIDEHCMPLVQLINSGTILNCFDRSTWRTKLIETDPCYDYILDFPKTAFHHKLFDFQEIIISNFRESGSKNKTPAVFVRDNSDAYAICYDNMLVLLQKENEKYYLKPFKAAESKMNPILMLENVHASKGENKGGLFELTLVFINVAVLTQVFFQKKDVWTRWHDFIYQMKSRTLKNKTETIALENTVDKYSEIKVKFQEFSSSHADFFKEEIKLGELDEKKLLFQMPNDVNEFLIGTSFDAVNILKTCYENLSLPLNADIFDNLLSQMSAMEKRISNYRNSQLKEILNTDDIECENLKDLLPDTSLLLTPLESPTIESDLLPDASLLITPESINIESELEFDFQSLVRHQNDDIIELNEDEEENLPDNVESNDEEDILVFVDQYVRKIIEEAQIELNNNTDSDDISILQVSSITSETSA